MRFFRSEVDGDGGRDRRKETAMAKTDCNLQRVGSKNSSHEIGLGHPRGGRTQWAAAVKNGGIAIGRGSFEPHEAEGCCRKAVHRESLQGADEESLGEERERTFMGKTLGQEWNSNNTSKQIHIKFYKPEYLRCKYGYTLQSRYFDSMRYLCNSLRTSDWHHTAVCIQRVHPPPLKPPPAG
ncbi:GTPase Era [Striga asiatica]|uniref:GTPase Era n=1 Tax=Striga asiatica TaxID=4170 RepID=A0A5A7QTQ6_STRAF|nr:GTPase Era [Striga asiatica]